MITQSFSTEVYFISDKKEPSFGFQTLSNVGISLIQYDVGDDEEEEAT